MTGDDDEERRRQIGVRIAKALGRTADVKVLAFIRPGDDADATLLAEATEMVRQARQEVMVMTDNAWNLLADGGVRLSDIEAICVVVAGGFTEIPAHRAQAILCDIGIFADYGDEGWIGSPIPGVGDFGMQVWTPDWIYRSRIDDGIVKLDRIARTVSVLMRR